MTTHDCVAVMSPRRAPGVRCPSCNAKLAEALHGWARFTCPRCKQEVELRADHDAAQADGQDAAA